MILIIDNYDSFTYNLYQQMAKLGGDVKVHKHDGITIKEIIRLMPTHIVISAGPKSPKDSGISMSVIKEFYKHIPILGVCLGHQCIGEVFGSQTVSSPVIMHGKTDDIHHNDCRLFEGVPQPFTVARYNSLTVDKLPDDFVMTAWSDDGSIMAMQHEYYPLYGVQFHPESFMTISGDLVMRRFLECAA
jgi:anthranilate synthase/aminodeoxychorismate synthase-like glutamine amidotransferase